MGNASGLPEDFEGRLRAALGRLEERINARAGFDGAQLTRTVQKLEELIDGILAQTDINASGNGTIGGNLTVGGSITSTGPMYTPHGRATPVTTSYVAAYLNADGRIGATVSSMRFKRDFSPADTADLVEALRTFALVRFRYIEAVESLGRDAPWELGGIAEYAFEAGLKDYVYLDADGKPLGINYERLTIPLIAAFQSIDDRVRALEAQSQ